MASISIGQKLSTDTGGAGYRRVEGMFQCERTHNAPLTPYVYIYGVRVLLCRYEAFQVLVVDVVQGSWMCHLNALSIIQKMQSVSPAQADSRYTTPGLFVALPSQHIPSRAKFAVESSSNHTTTTTASYCCCASNLSTL